MIILEIKRKKGFILLFTVMLSSIILSVALGVTNIAFKEARFSTSVENSNEAFLAADVGAECALFNDKSVLPYVTKFPLPASATAINSCAGQSPVPTLSNVSATTATYTFRIYNLAFSGQACTEIIVEKDNTTPPIMTTITAKGLNIGDASCDPINLNSVEREIKVTY